MILEKHINSDAARGSWHDKLRQSRETLYVLNYLINHTTGLMIRDV